MSFSCLTCQAVQRTESDLRAGDDDSIQTSRRCVEVVGCWTRRALQHQQQQHQQQQQQQQLQEEHQRQRQRQHHHRHQLQHNEEEEEEDPPMRERIMQQQMPAEPRLMRCRAVRRDWNFEDLQSEIGCA
ncbi:hypothetical protein AMTRI_Chr04g246590 [Amborella trichopoda]